MKTKILIAFLSLSTLNSQLSTVLAQGTTITYQGRLTDLSSIANGSYDFTFQLFVGSPGTELEFAL